MTNNKPEIRFGGYTFDWEQRMLGDFYFFKNGLNKGKEFFGSGTPIVNFTDVYHNRGIYFSKLKGRVNLSDDEIKTYEVKKGDIFFTRTSETIEEIGYPSVMVDEPRDTVFSGFVLRGRAINEDPLEINFKRYAFFSEKFREEMKKKSSMTTRALTSGTALKKMTFHIPESIEEQQRIGLFFKKLDDTIALQQCKYEKLINLKKAMLKKMFPQRGKVVPEIRFSGFTDDWKQLKLGDHSEIKTGGTPKTDISEYWFPKEIPWMSSGEVHKKRLSNTDNKISKKGLENSSARWVKEKSILIALAGQGKTRGTVAINEIPITTNQSIAAIEVSSSLDSEFVLQNLESRYEELRIISSGDGTRGGLNKQLIANIQILAPSVEEQEKIGMFFKELDITISLQKDQLNKLQQVKNSMLQKMLV